MSGIGVTEHFGGFASRYDRAYDAVDADGHALRARMAAVLRLLGPGPGTVLDAGMGPGRLVAELDRAGWTAFGVDATDEMVAIGRERLPHLRERLAQGRIESIPHEDETFDAVVATGVLEYAGPEAAIPEIHRVLREGGRAIVSYPNPQAIYGIWKTRVFYPLVRTTKRIARRQAVRFPRGAGIVYPDAFAELLDACGFTPESRVYTSYLPTITPLDSLLPRMTARLGQRLEGSSDRIGKRVATQIVYAARKR